MNLITWKDIFLKLRKKEKEKKQFWKQIEREDKDGNSCKKEKDKLSPESKKLIACGNSRRKRKEKREDDHNDS